MNASKAYLPCAGEPGYPSPSEIAAGPTTTQPLAGPRFEHQVEHLHHLGPRVIGELLAEIAHATGEETFIANRLEVYAELDPEVVRFVGGDRFPPMPLGVVW